jgi:hypothetical protein
MFIQLHTVLASLCPVLLCLEWCTFPRYVYSCKIIIILWCFRRYFSSSYTVWSSWINHCVYLTRTCPSWLASLSQQCININSVLALSPLNCMFSLLWLPKCGYAYNVSHARIP